jgi:polyisoprenoid-binding protein YceI
MSGPLSQVVLPGLALFVPLLVALTAPGARAAPRRYTLDPTGSQLAIHVGKAGLFGFAGHEHDVVAGTFHGTATFDPDRIAQSAVDLTFDAGGLQVIGKGEPSGDAAEVQTAMLGPTCLDAHRFPTVRFLSKTVTAAGAAAPGDRDHRLDLDLQGELTIHGVTRPLTFRVHLEIKGDALEATGSTTIRQTDFGMTPISKAGVVKVKDELAINWRIRGTAH